MATPHATEVPGADWSGPLPRIVHQATGRLEHADVSLDGVAMPMILEHPEQLDEWLAYVRKTLTDIGIQRVMDPKLPRPYKSYGMIYQKWRKLSKELAIWLAAGVQPDFLTKINPRKRKLDYADKFIDHLTEVLENHQTHEVLNKVFDLLTIKSSNYLTTYDFLHDFQGQFHHLRSEGIMVSPYEALCSLMWQVKLAGHEDLYKSMITKMRTEADDLDGSTVKNTFTFEKFGQACDEVIYRLANGRPPDGWSAENRKNAPPAGTPIATHLRFWEDSVIQRNADNMCFYCGEHPHDVKQCWYLHPGYRPADWIPSPPIWIYKEGVNNGHTRVGHGIYGHESSDSD